MKTTKGLLSGFNQCDGPAASSNRISLKREKKLLQHLNEICCSSSTHMTLFSGFMLKLVHVAEYSFESVETPVLSLLTGTAGCKNKLKIHDTTVCFGDVKNM